MKLSPSPSLSPLDFRLMTYRSLTESFTHLKGNIFWLEGGSFPEMGSILNTVLVVVLNLFLFRYVNLEDMLLDLFYVHELLCLTCWFVYLFIFCFLGKVKSISSWISFLKLKLLYSFSCLGLWITASDYYQFDDLLTSEEQAVRMKVRECMEKEIAPIMVEVYSSWYFATFFLKDDDELVLLGINYHRLHWCADETESWFLYFLFKSFIPVLGESRISLSCYSKAWCPTRSWWHNKGDFTTLEFKLLRPSLR